MQPQLEGIFSFYNAARMTAWPLEPTPDEMRRLLHAAGERVIAHVASLAEQPAAQLEGAAEAARAVSRPDPPEHGQPFDELLALIFEQATPPGFNAAGPGYLAYIPGGGLFSAALADLIADAVNRFTGLWLAAPALVQLETDAIRWLCRFVGYPPGAGGILTSGGSLANLSALAAARHEKLGADFRRGVLYVSDQTHHSLLKAALLLGFEARQVRALPSDERFRLSVPALERQMRADRDAGLAPFLLIANGGSTNTGAVDDLDALADLAARENLWLHVDAAYGGFFALTERGREVLRGLARSDSLTLDPHKSLFLPYGTGSLLVRDPETLRRAHAVPAEYLPQVQADPERVDFSELSPELSRDYRGLRLWLPLALHGVAAFRAALDEKLDLARFVADELRSVPELEIVAEPQLTVVAFRMRDGALTVPEAEARNRALLERVNARQRVFLSGTLLRGRFALRICVGSFRTHRERIEAALDDVRAAVSELR